MRHEHDILNPCANQEASETIQYMQIKVTSRVQILTNRTVTYL